MKKKDKKSRPKPIYGFIDASNLFYGGEKSLGWKIDYNNLLKYLNEKYCVKKCFYYGGIELFGYDYSIFDNKPINLNSLKRYLYEYIDSDETPKYKVALMGRAIKTIDFYRKLEKFGYILCLKPVKVFNNGNGKLVKKANCDVDMTFDLMRYMEQYSGVVALTGDGDFAIVLRYLINHKRKLIVLARGDRTAKEIKHLVGPDFRDFVTLRKRLEYKK